MAESQIELNVMDKSAAAAAEAELNTQLIRDDCRAAAELKAKTLKWWAQILVYSVLVLAGQSSAVLLGRLYFEKGGKSEWLSSLVQVAGFPVFLPLYCFLPQEEQAGASSPALGRLCLVYVSLGLLLALDCMLYSVGLLYLPVSTYSLVGASQLAFNALFAFLLNKHQFTPYIVNSLVVLTISSALLVFHPSDSSSSARPGGVTKRSRYVLGFACTLAASALFGLILPLTQLAYDRVIKSHASRAILDMLIYQNLVATCATAAGLLASGEWATLQAEMRDFQLGRLSYLMTLVWIALAWQIFALGALKLITQVSSLFSNVISTLGLPIVPVLAVLLFRDNMDWIKAVAMVLAIWGFTSYAYQCYIDHNQDRSTTPPIPTTV